MIKTAKTWQNLKEGAVSGAHALGVSSITRFPVVAYGCNLIIKAMGRYSLSVHFLLTIKRKQK